MPLESANITFDLADQLGVDFDPRRTKVWITTNVPGDTVIDTSGNKIRLGSGNVTVNPDGTGQIDVWKTGQTGLNPLTWQTTVHVDYPDRNARGGRGRRDFGPFTITSSVDLTDLVAEQEIPPTYVSTVTAQLDAKVTEASAFAAAAAASAAQAQSVADIDTPDALVATLVPTSSGSATSAALSATIGTALAADPTVNAERYGAVGDGTANDTAALVAALATGKSVALKKGATYLVDAGLIVGSQALIGNGATIKRRNQFSTTTTTSITSGSTTSITVASAAGFRVGQSITVVNGSTFDTSNRVISNINGNVITVSTAFGVTVSGTTTVHLSFNTLTVTGGGLIDNVRLDGNKANWTFNRWQNTSEIVTTGDRNIVRGVYSNNAPGEGVVLFGNRNVIRDSWFTNLNGNGVHFSGAAHPVCDNVTVINANLDTSVGHADGCIIWSNAITDATISNCYMEGGISGIGSIDSSDNCDVTIIGNTIRNPTTYAMDLVSPQQNPSNIVITGNRIYCNANTPLTISNTNASPTVWPSQIIFANNYLSAPAGAVLMALTRVKKVTVEGNHFDLGTATTGSSLSLSLSEGANVRSNMFTGGNYGVVADATKGGVIAGNQFHNQFTGAINCTNAGTSHLIMDNYITNDATASASYNGILARDRHVVRGNYIELTGGRSGIYPQNGAIVKGNTVRHGAATYSIRADGGTSGIILKDNEVTVAISNSSGAANPETGTIVIP